MRAAGSGRRARAAAPRATSASALLLQRGPRISSSARLVAAPAERRLVGGGEHVRGLDLLVGVDEIAASTGPGEELLRMAAEELVERIHSPAT